MRILVTGGAGVIAPYLVTALKQQGHLVSTLDVIGDCDYLCDITDARQVESVFKRCAPERVYHMAAHVGREYSENKPKVVQVNVLGTYNIAKACADTKAEIVNFSTSEVYGNHNGIKVDEDAHLNPINLYGVTKLAAENIVRYLVRVYGLKAMIVRPFMIYGGEPDKSNRSALSRFFYGIRGGKAIEVYAQCTRAWCYVTDLVAGITNEFVEGTFNIGNDIEPITMLELYYRQAAIAGAKGHPAIIYNEPNKITVAYKAAKFNRAVKLLGYEPKVDLTEGLIKTWETM